MKRFFYHTKCIDGNACIWVMSSYFAKDAYTSHGIAFGTDYESIIFDNVNEGDTVYFMDFSPTDNVLNNLLDKCEKIYIIDHHVNNSTIAHDKIISYIDETHCGAYNVFKYLYPNREVPNILKYIDVTDLIMTDAKHYYETAAFIRTLEDENLEKSLLDIEKYKDVDLDYVIEHGKEIFKQDYIKMEEELGEIFYREIEVKPGARVLFPLVKANIYDMGAEIDYKLKQLQEDPNPNGEIPYISCAYFYQNELVRLNIRTNTLYFDASEVAAYLGSTYGIAPGGGHRNVAVARFTFEQFESLFATKG